MELEIEWRPEEIIWRIDAKQIRSVKNKAAEKLQGQSMRLEFTNMASNLYPFSDFFTDDELPAQGSFDYIEVYTYNEDGSFSYAWRDDFDSWDTSRWVTVADPGWDLARGSFTPANVAIKDGQLKLAISSTAKPNPLTAVPSDFDDSEPEVEVEDTEGEISLEDFDEFIEAIIEDIDLPPRKKLPFDDWITTSDSIYFANTEEVVRETAKPEVPKFKGPLISRKSAQIFFWAIVVFMVVVGCICCNMCLFARMARKEM